MSTLGELYTPVWAPIILRLKKTPLVNSCSAPAVPLAPVSPLDAAYAAQPAPDMPRCLHLSSYFAGRRLLPVCSLHCQPTTECAGTPVTVLAAVESISFTDGRSPLERRDFSRSVRSYSQVTVRQVPKVKGQIYHIPRDPALIKPSHVFWGEGSLYLRPSHASSVRGFGIPHTTRRNRQETRVLTPKTRAFVKTQEGAGSDCQNLRNVGMRRIYTVSTLETRDSLQVRGICAADPSRGQG